MSQMRKPHKHLGFGLFISKIFSKVIKMYKRVF